MNLDNIKYIFVIPTFDDQQASARLFDEINNIYSKKAHIVVIDDGSVCHPIDVNTFNGLGLSGTIIRLRRNVGHQKAIAIGLNYLAQFVIENQFIIVMDADGEDKPESINLMLESLLEKDVDIVVAQRRHRVETIQFKISYILYKLVFSMLTGRNINFGNFMALNSSSLNRLAAMQELQLHLAASVLISKLRIRSVIIDRGPRYAGKSKMNLMGLVLHAFRALMVFAEDVLVRIGVFCLFVAGFSVSFSLFAIILKLMGFATPGWFSVALGVLIVIFLQTGALALVALILTGVVRSDYMVKTINFKDLINQIIKINCS